MYELEKSQLHDNYIYREFQKEVARFEFTTSKRTIAFTNAKSKYWLKKNSVIYNLYRDKDRAEKDDCFHRCKI